MINPPAIGPMADDMPITAPVIANALPLTGSAKSSWMKAVTAGTKVPPARPWSTRNMTS